MLLRIGACVRTNYNTGPFIVKTLSAPCTCAAYHDHLNGRDRPSKPYFHMEVADLAGRSGYYLNGYTLDGRSVWGPDRLLDASQRELFSDL
ncbi:hypothetical protein BX589_12022 [Paraburkholderia fungorum]|uniref:hypothetical protein n=1 Tax=Paraburkholderia fungorum TaxID=134537 RepID=UPI000D4DA72D|nr:hypothetical protein [Paraburkholderia fungorum]PRZ51181.1 hypothetical protein BX589_12022 [Paraburkholderia fungorum]